MEGLSLKANHTEMAELMNRLGDIETQLSEIMTMLDGKAARGGYCWPVGESP